MNWCGELGGFETYQSAIDGKQSGLNHSAFLPRNAGTVLSCSLLAAVEVILVSAERSRGMSIFAFHLERFGSVGVVFGAKRFCVYLAWHSSVLSGVSCLRTSAIASLLESVPGPWMFLVPGETDSNFMTNKKHLSKVI